MKTIVPFLLPVAILLLLVLRKAPKKSTTTARPDFIRKASDSIHGAEVSVATSSNNEAPEGVDYNYDVVGESFQRDHLMALIRSHKAFETGEILTTAVLEPEPTNPFDSTAVKVVIEGVQVGYIAKFDSGAVTKMIEKSGKKSYEVPARIGFDADSPAPLIGVRLALQID